MHDPLFWLYADNYRTYNVEVSRSLGSIYAAILLSELASKFKYYEERNTLTQDGFFYYTQEDVEERTCLTRKNQDTAIKILESFNLIEKKVVGIPPKRFFKLNVENIIKFFENSVKKKSTNLSETDKLNCPKRTNCIVRNGQIGHIYNKPKDEQQLPESPSAPVVVFFPSLNKLDLSEKLKCDLSYLYYEEDIDLAVKRCLAWKGRESDEVAIRHIFKNFNTWNDVVSQEETEEKNKIFFETLKMLDGKKLGCVEIKLGFNYIEFISGMKYTSFSLKDVNFECLVKEHLDMIRQKLGIKS